MAEDKPQNEQELLDWANGLHDEGEDRSQWARGQWWENMSTYLGDFWVEWDVHNRRLYEPVPKPSHKVRLPVNLAQPVVRTEKAKLVKNRPLVNVIPQSNDRSDLNAAEVGDKMLNGYAEREFSMPKVRRRMLDWVLICGLGGIFVDYDEKAESPIEVYLTPDGEPIWEERVIEAYKAYYKRKKESPKKMEIPQGELRIMPLSPFQLIWDFSKNYIEDASWCIIKEVFDVHDIERRWEKEVEGDDDAIPAVMGRRMMDKFSRNTEIAAPTHTQQMAEVRRLFVKPGHIFFPNGLHLVYTENEIILKENYPYEHGELPVTIMGHIALPTSQFPMSVLQQVRPIVLELSKTESQIIENRNMSANPIWRIAKQLRIDQEFVSKPGLRLVYQHVPNIPPPEPIQMPDIPSYVKELVPTLKEHVLEISGQGETSQGRIPPGARSGVAIGYLQEEDDTRLGPTVTEFEETMERVGDHTLSHFAQFYEIPRTIRLFRKHSEPEVFDFVGTQLEGNTSCQVQAGSALPRSKAAKQQFMLDLWDRKLVQDPRRVLEMLELSDAEREDLDYDFDQAERENRKLSLGQPVEVKDWHNHAAHHYKHRQFMKTADWEALSPELQQGFEAHDDEHTQKEQAQQMEQAYRQGQASQLGDMTGGGGEAPPDQMMSNQGSGSAGEAANGVNVPAGPNGQFAQQETPRSIVNDVPQ